MSIDEDAVAIDGVLADLGYTPTKWVMSVEIIDDEGGRCVRTLHSGDLRAWDILGLVEFVRADVFGLSAASVIDEMWEAE